MAKRSFKELLKENVRKILIGAAGILVASLATSIIGWFWALGSRVNALENQGAIRDIKIDGIDKKSDLTVQRTGKILCLMGEKSECS